MSSEANPLGDTTGGLDLVDPSPLRDNAVYLIGRGRSQLDDLSKMLQTYLEFVRYTHDEQVKRSPTYVDRAIVEAHLQDIADYTQGIIKTLGDQMLHLSEIADVLLSISLPNLPADLVGGEIKRIDEKRIDQVILEATGHPAVAAFMGAAGAQTADKLIERFLLSQKCKFCGALISQRDTFCHRCGKSQV
jgi:hypothetical protein